MQRRRLSLTLVLLVAAAFPALAQDVPRLRAGTLPDTFRLDGRLDEPAWAQTPAIDGLTMIEPAEGAAPPHKTIVRVLANPTAIVIGVVCEDDPAGIVSFTKARDGSFGSEDHIRIVLDTFMDGRSGYVFQVNPSGARYDGLINVGGDGENADWDGIWDARTSVDAGGWSVEIRIPIQTLSFKRGNREWHFNLQRRIQRLQETDRWASPRRDWKITQTSQAGILTGLPDFTLGAGLTVRPALVGGAGIAAAGEPASATGDASLDVQQRFGPNVLGAVSFNTDFAETEVDARQTNLTRFPLFFPEKRTFFLEGSDLFEFGLGLESDVVPFFSRRMGLVSGREVPILAAGKLNGRVGRTSVSGVFTRTRAVTDVAPAASMSALRIKQSLWRESSIGLIATVGDPQGGASWLAGPDLTYRTSRFRGDKNFLVGAWALAMSRDGTGRTETAAGIRLDYPNDLWDVSFTARGLSRDFFPPLGFVARPGVYNLNLTVDYSPRPNNGWLRQMFYEFENTFVTNLQGRWESYRLFMAPINWRFESGDRMEFNVVPVGEQLIAPADIAGVVVPAGAYHWRRYRLEAGSASKRRLSGQATWWFGGFYAGRLHQIELTGTWHPSSLVAVDLTAEHDDGDLPAGRFVQTLVGIRGHLNVTSDLQVTSFVQYDTESGLVGTNSRLRWTFRPAGDLFVIYNHNIRDITDRWQLESNQLLIKLQYAFRY